MVKKYTEEFLKKVKDEYPTRDDIKTRNFELYYNLRHRKHLNLIYPESISDGKFTNKFTADDIFEMVKGFKTKKDINEFYPTLRKIAKRMGIWDTISQNLRPLGNSYNRLVYAYEFDDNYVYVGLTYNVDIRDKSHTGKHKVSYSGVYNHINETNIVPHRKIISNGYINYIEAAELETLTIDEYRKNGWYILNKVKGGGLGGGCHKVIKYTIDYIKYDSSKYNTLKDFRKNSNGSFQAAKRKGKVFFREITNHMIVNKTNYTIEEIKEKVLKYDSIISFNKDKALCEVIRRRGKVFQQEMKELLQKKINPSTHP